MAEITKPVKVKKADVVAEAILQLAEGIKSLEKNILQKLEKQPAAVIPEKSGVPEAVAAPADPTFPLSWRMIIDTVLNAKFKASVNYRSDANFELSVFVPREYSNAKPAHWDMFKEDRRMKVISNASGEIGIREYVTQILENLNLDIRMKIADDRAKLANA